MDNEQLRHIAEFMAHAEPTESSWTEQRWAVDVGENTYILTSNIPGWDSTDPNAPADYYGLGWTTGQLIQYFKSVGYEPYLLEVEVKIT